MNQKHFVPPLAHATPDPNHKTATARNRHTRHATVTPAVVHEHHRGVERLVLAIVWGSVAGLLAIAMTTKSFQKPPRQLTRYEKAMGRVRGLNSHVHDWFNS